MEVTLVLWHWAWGMGWEFACAGKGLLELVEVVGASVFCSACLCWGCCLTGRALWNWNWSGLGAQGCERVLAPVRIGGSCLWASGNPIHSEEPEPAAAFPLAICKSVKYSCRATCESRLTLLSVSRFSSPAQADSACFSCGSSGVAGIPQIFCLASGAP